MHRPVKEHLEEFLEGKTDPAALGEFTAHIERCGECREMVELLKTQARLVRTLRDESELEPRPGFYARVMGVIESQSRPSIWSVLLDPAFGRRLFYATCSVFLLFGLYMYSSDPMAPGASPEALLTEQRPPVVGDQQRDRDVILVNLATYRD